MFPGLLEAITTLGGMVIPPVLDLVRKKIIGRDSETPEATLATLATSKPDVIPATWTPSPSWSSPRPPISSGIPSATPPGGSLTCGRPYVRSSRSWRSSPWSSGTSATSLLMNPPAPPSASSWAVGSAPAPTSRSAASANPDGKRHRCTLRFYPVCPSPSPRRTGYCPQPDTPACTRLLAA